MNSLVVTFDCLPLRFLGAYGNLWVRTPNFDRLAAESSVFHQHYAAWTGEPFSGLAWWNAEKPTAASMPLSKELQQRDSLSLKTLQKAGVRTLWRGEARDRRRLPVDRPFESRAVFLGEDRFDGEADQTAWFQMVEDSIRLLPRLFRTMSSPWLLWLQSVGVPAPYSAPMNWALKYLDFDVDSDPKAAAATVARLSDPSAAADWTAADWKFSRGLCAGYVALIDAVLGGLLDALDAAPTGKQPLLIVMAGRGRTLGFRPDVPSVFRSVLSETAQTPLFIRCPGQLHGQRRQELAQTTDLWPTLYDAFGIGTEEIPGDETSFSLLPWARGEETRERDIVTTRGGGGIALRTRERMAMGASPSHRAAALEPPEPQLFIKPDDLWETLDVGSSTPAEMDEWRQRLENAIE